VIPETDQGTWTIGVGYEDGSELQRSGVFGGPGLMMADGDIAPGAHSTPLAEGQLDPIVEEAVRRLALSAGSEATALSQDISVQIADLPGRQLGHASADKVFVDWDAAGHGWFVDPTPWDDSEFSQTVGPYERIAPSDSPAEGRVDLLTAVMHELGHIFGYDHAAAHDVMHATLPLGTRRLPGDESAFLADAADTDEWSNSNLLNAEAIDRVFASLPA